MSGLARWARLSFRLQRWEVIASVVGVGALAALMLWFAWQLRILAAGQPGCPDPGAYVPGCEAFAQRFQGLSDQARYLIYLSWGAPFGMGVVLGVPIVARELEGRTAGMAWTLSSSRVRWLAGRFAAAAVVVVALLSVLVLCSGILAAAMMPHLQLDRDFTWIGRRDWLIVARGLAALGIGVLVGAVVGRQLPGLLAAAFASVLVFTGVSVAMDRWNEAEAQVVAGMNGGIGSDTGGALLLGSRILLPTGELATWNDLFARGLFDISQDMDGRMYASWVDVGHPERAIGEERQLIIPGERYPAVLVRESGVALGIGAVLTLAAATVVRRRRPA